MQSLYGFPYHETESPVFVRYKTYIGVETATTESEMRKLLGFFGENLLGASGKGGPAWLEVDFPGAFVRMDSKTTNLGTLYVVVQTTDKSTGTKKKTIVKWTDGVPVDFKYNAWKKRVMAIISKNQRNEEGSPGTVLRAGIPLWDIEFGN